MKKPACNRTFNCMRCQITNKHVYHFFLHIRDLSYNLLKTWQNPLKNHLPALQSLNLAHNEDFLMDKEQFLHTNCSMILGVNISPNCKACNFTRDKNVTGKIIIKKLLSRYKRNCIYFPKESNAFLEEFRRVYVSYNGGCMTRSKKCSMAHLTSNVPLFKRLKDVCYSGTRKLRPIVYVLGSIALVLNLIVLTSILSIKNLRRLVPFLLVAHLSFCDMLMGIYAIGTAVGHEVSPDFHDIEVYRTDNSKCPVFWVLFLFGQTLGVCTCVLVTIERYLATVYCMKPMLKLEMQTTFFILPGFWLIAILIAFPLQLIDYQKITLNFMCVLLRDYSAKKGFFVSQGLMIAFLILYIIIVFLYVRIYISVRNSSRQVMVDIKREARLARRIGVIVFTNFICFALPNLSMLVFTTTQMYVGLDDILNTIIRRWLPPMVLVLNACANPCFFAYGNDKFLSSLKSSLRSFLSKYLGVDGLMVGNNRVGPSIEMKTASTSASTN